MLVQRIDELRAHLEGHTEILFAVLYGSVSEGRPFRELDVGLYVDRAQVAASDDLDYGFRMADELQAAISFSVDVRVINDAPLGFRYNVRRGIPLVVNDAEAYARFQDDLDAFRRQILEALNV